jgi:hypothetical protein
MKGILFKHWKIKAIAENPDREWQTRRVIKPQPIICKGVMRWEKNKGNRFVSINMDKHGDLAIPFARYQVGETVYIKEAYYPIFRNMATEPVMCYKLDQRDPSCVKQWHSPMMMPEKYARHFIKILAIKAERLQEISWLDCLAEGIGEDKEGFFYDTHYSVPQGAFIELWDSINRDYQWDSNPFVFAYTFRNYPQLSASITQKS